MSYVIGAPRVGDTNAPTTGEALVGVVRHLVGLDGDVYGKQYKTAVLDAPGAGETDYFVWAASGGQLTGRETWAKCGSDRINKFGFINDDFGREVSWSAIAYALKGVVYDDEGWVNETSTVPGRAGSAPYPYTTNGKIPEGAQIIEAIYRVLPATFWWTKNDRYMRRFDDEKMELYRGNAPQNLGVLSGENFKFKLNPAPHGLIVGEKLEPNILRLGSIPNFDVYIVNDIETSTHEIALHVSSGELIFRGGAVDHYSGLTLYYHNPVFDEEADGYLGKLSEGPSFYICPIPSRGELPLISIGSRAYLKLVEGVTIPGEGEFLLDYETGLITLSPFDFQKANARDDRYFDKEWAQDGVFYHGLVMNSISQGVLEEVEIPIGGAVPYATLKKSGLFQLPDGTGSFPNLALPPNRRPGGPSGKIYSLDNGLSDFYCFSPNGDRYDVLVVDTLPKRLAKDTVYFTPSDKKFKAKQEIWTKGTLYFQQSLMTPSTFTKEARISTRVRHVFRFPEGASFTFEVDGIPYTLNIPVDNGPVHPQAVAEMFRALGTFEVEVSQGAIVISGSNSIDTLDGCAPLGIPPFWRAVKGDDNWLADSGISFGFFRAPKGSDLNAYGLMDNEEKIKQGAVKFLNPQSPPLQDRGEYFFSIQSVVEDEDEAQVVEQPLRNYEDIVYRFGDRLPNFVYVQRGGKLQSFDTPTNTIQFDQFNLIGESLARGYEPGGLFVSTPNGGGFQRLYPGEDYILDATAGNAELIEPVGQRLLTGAAATLNADGILTDKWADFSEVQPHFRVKVDNYHSYIVGEVLSKTKLKLVGVEQSGRVRFYEIFFGLAPDVYDPALLADFVYRPFIHFDEGKPPYDIIIHTKLEGFIPPSVELEGAYLYTDTQTIPLRELKQFDLGEVKENGIFLPDNCDEVRLGSGRFDVAFVNSATYSADVECINSTRELSFRPQILRDYEGVKVFALETPTIIGQYDRSNRRVFGLDENKTYWIAQPKSEYTLSPLSGTLAFNQPINVGQKVEAVYHKATGEGRKVEGQPIREFLPSFVQYEKAQRIDATTYTIEKEVAFGNPIILIGAIVLEEHEYSYQDGKIHFYTRAIPENVDVLVNYAVHEVQIPTRVFELSHKPIYSPPFFIHENKEYFGLRGDRRQEFPLGALIRVGADTKYVTKRKYFPESNITRIDFFPPTRDEIGSRAPGLDSLLLITHAPLAAGFMMSVSSTLFPYAEISRGQNEIVVNGDITPFAVAGHIIEVAGIPMTIVSAMLTEDKLKTKVTTAAAFSVDVPAGGALRLSVRPIYPPNATALLGRAPLRVQDEYEIVRFKGGIGTPDTGAMVDHSTGNVTLSEPLEAGDKVFFRATRIRQIKPTFVEGQLVSARAGYNCLYAENVYKGGTLRLKYTFRNPDKFFCKIQPLNSFMAHAAQEAIEEITNKAPAGGPLIPKENSQAGRIGLRGHATLLQNKDRAARHYLEFYNNAVVLFEAASETMTGLLVGDRDGKFQFKIEYDHPTTFPAPGFEDEYSGTLTPRFIWQDIAAAENPLWNYTLSAEDGIYLPESLVRDPVTEEVSGNTISVKRFRQYAFETQKPFVTNDVDDIVLIGANKATYKRVSAPPYVRYSFTGRYDRMGGIHPLSRIFPTTTHAFFTTMPGEYSAEETRGSEIAQVSNPALGAIENISSYSFSARLPRSRVWGFYPRGKGAPCFYAYMTALNLLELDPATRSPDKTKLLSQGGDVPDLITGDAETSLPPFLPGQQLALGKPDGTIIHLFYEKEMDVFGKKRLEGVFIHSIEDGYIVRLAQSDGEKITSAVKLRGFSEIEKGDTLFVIPKTGKNQSISNPPSLEDLQAISEALVAYRNGFDVHVKPNGSVVDMTLPSFSDPTFFGLKEIFGQNPPVGLSNLEGEVTFFKDYQNPVKLPCLKGEPLDDSGDYKIPYLNLANSEFAVLTNLKHNFTFVPPDELYLESTPVTNGVLDFSDTTGIQPYDFLLIETSNATPSGILSVGKVDGNRVYPPRFISPSPKGNHIRYTLKNFFTFVDGYSGNTPQADTPRGVTLVYDGTYSYISFEHHDIDIILNDGSSGNGQINNLTAEVTIQLVTREDSLIGIPGGAILATIYLNSNFGFARCINYAGNDIVIPGAGTIYGTTLGGQPSDIKHRVIRVTGNLFNLNQSWCPHTIDGFGVHTSVYGYDCLIDIAVVTSPTAYIEDDRVSFWEEDLDLRKITLEGVVHPLNNALSLETELRVLEVEGQGGAPLSVNNFPITFKEPSLKAPSWPNTPDDTISALSVVRTIASAYNASGDVVDDSRLTNFTTLDHLDEVEQGDVVYIKSGALGKAAACCGSYIVSHVIEPDAIGISYQEVEYQDRLLDSFGVLKDLRWPKVVSYDKNTHKIIMDRAFPGGVAPTKIYVILDPEKLESNDVNVFKWSLWSADVVLYDNTFFEVTVGSNSYLTAISTDQPVLDSLVTLSPGSFVVPNNVQFPLDMPEGSIQSIKLITPHGDDSSPTWAHVDVAIADPLIYLPVEGQKWPNKPESLTFTAVNFNTLNNPHTHPNPNVGCFIPQITNIDMKHNMDAGIFLEPSVPVTGQIGNLPYIVDVNHNLAAPSMVGIRNINNFGGAGPERVDFIVHHARRWKKETPAFDDILRLRPLYEKRRGRVTNYDPASRVLTASGFDMDLADGGGLVNPAWRTGESNLRGTNLGGFDKTIHAGATIHFDNGEKCRIQAIVSEDEIKLEKPGLLNVGDTFWIDLHQPVIPLEQTLDQLLDLVTLKKIGSGIGAVVNVTNELTLSNTIKGIEPGDILYIEPRGEIGLTQERGEPPRGGVGYTDGLPSPFDDNRGFYYIVNVDGLTLTVDGEHFFTKDFGIPGSTEYSALPNVTDENRNDLRVTGGPAPDGSYDGNYPDPADRIKSIDTFAFHIIRPSKRFTKEQVEIVLFLRERVATWIDQLRKFWSGKKRGSYRQFQEEAHIDDLHDIDGAGYISDALIALFKGIPNTSNEQAMSVLDRLFWLGEGGYPDLLDEIVGPLRNSRYMWLSYRTHRVLGTLTGIDRYKEELPKMIQEWEEAVRRGEEN